MKITILTDEDRKKIVEKYLENTADAFAEFAKKEGITGLKRTDDPENSTFTVSTPAPEAAAREFGDGKNQPEGWVGKAIFGIGGRLA